MIQIRNASFTYEEDHDFGLHNITLTIPKGQCVVLTGTSGCGKTTLARLINGLVPHFYSGELRGSVLIDGVDISRWKSDELSKKVGTVFQNPRSQFFNLDTTSEIAFGCENLGWDRKKIHRRVQKTIRNLGISHLMDRDIFSLSGGEKQMVAIASIYAMGVDVFVMDEPSANLDAQSIKQLEQMIERIKSEGKTIIIAEHRLFYLKKTADRILYVKNGFIEKDWSANEFSKLTKKERLDLGLRAYDLKRTYVKSNHSGVKIGDNAAKIPKKSSVEDFLVEDLSASYSGDKPVLRNITCRASKGEIIAIIGGNGRGKSTFARCLCGLMKEKKGTVQHNGQTLSYKKRLGEIYQVMQDSTCQLFSDSVMGELDLASKIKDKRHSKRTYNAKPLDTANSSDLIRQVLKQLSLTGLEDRHPMSLSGGEKQRLAIAAGIVQNSNVMILDEPTSGLDYYNMQCVKSVMETLRDEGKYLFVITHDYEFLLSTCSRVIEIENGTIQRDYPVDQEHLPLLQRFFVI